MYKYLQPSSSNLRVSGKSAAEQFFKVNVAKIYLSLGLWERSHDIQEDTWEKTFKLLRHWQQGQSLSLQKFADLSLTVSGDTLNSRKDPQW